MFEQDWHIFQMVNSGTWRDPSQWPTEYRERLKAYKEAEIYFRDDIHDKIRQDVKPDSSYRQYQDVCAKLVARYVFYLVAHDMKTIIEGLERTWVKIIIKDRQEIECYAFHDEVSSLADQCYIQLSGQFLLGRVYAPWLYKARIDASVIDRTVSHEMQHQVECVRGLYEREYKMQDKIKRFMRIHPNQWLGCMSQLYGIFCNIYTEGLATFINRRYGARIIFDLPKIEKHMELLEKIAKTPDKEKSIRIYEDEFRPTFYNGEYYVGYLMCCTIGINLLRQKPGRFKAVHILHPKDEWISFKDLDRFLHEHKVVQIEFLDQETFNQTYTLLTKINDQREFIRLYTRACDELGLTWPAKFYDFKFFDHLKRLATKYYERYSRVIEKKYEND